MRLTAPLRLLGVLLVLASPLASPAQPPDAPIELIVSELGMPTAGKPEAARKINELFLFEGRLYVGSGDATLNTGPTDVICYDFEKGAFATEFTVDDEAILRYRELDGRLVIPGVDSTEEWDFGNVYVREGGKWTKHRSLPRAIHVLDVAAVGTAWWAAAAVALPLTDKERVTCGALFISHDRGASWRLQQTTPASATAAYRFTHLTTCGGRLFAFPYAQGTVPRDALPAPVAAALENPLTDKGREFFLVAMGDPLGGPDAVSVGGAGWRYAELVPTPSAMIAKAVALGDTLILHAVIGSPVPASLHFDTLKHGPVPGVATELWAFDGRSAKKIPLAVDSIRTMIVRDGSLAVLAVRDRRMWIAETRDAASWAWLRLPELASQPLSMERVGEDFYLGFEDGAILRAGRPPRD